MAAARILHSLGRTVEHRAGQIHQQIWHGPDIEAANIGAITAEEYYRRCAARLGVDTADVRLCIEAAFSGEYVNEQLVAYVRTIRERFKIVALTNTWSFGRALIARRGISNLFDLIIISAEEGIQKPNPRMFELVLERLAISPAQAIFVDDSDEHIAAARTLGIASIPFHTTPQMISALDRLLATYDTAGRCFNQQ